MTNDYENPKSREIEALLTPMVAEICGVPLSHFIESYERLVEDKTEPTTDMMRFHMRLQSYILALESYPEAMEKKEHHPDDNRLRKAEGLLSSMMEEVYGIPPQILEIDFNLFLQSARTRPEEGRLTSRIRFYLRSLEDFANRLWTGIQG